jgi:hypothetical protein
VPSAEAKHLYTREMPKAADSIGCNLYCLHWLNYREVVFAPDTWCQLSSECFPRQIWVHPSLQEWGMSVFLVKANGIRGYGTVLELLERSRKGMWRCVPCSKFCLQVQQGLEPWPCAWEVRSNLVWKFGEALVILG